MGDGGGAGLAAQGEGVLVGALTGAREHALKHAAAGVDILVVSGTEAGGHCGEISTMVVVPDVIEAVKDYPGVHVLAAGGIGTGRQMAAAMAMGAAGVWTGSIWLTTEESDSIPSLVDKLLEADSTEEEGDEVLRRIAPGEFSLGGLDPSALDPGELDPLADATTTVPGG